MVQHGVDEGVKNIYKTNVILHVFKVKGTPGAATKWIPKNKNRKTTPENECLVRSPGELLEAPNWTIKARKAFPCSAALVPFFVRAFSCSMALVFGFVMFPWVVQHGPVRASEISIDVVKFYIFRKQRKNDGVSEADAKD